MHNGSFSLFQKVLISTVLLAVFSGFIYLIKDLLTPFVIAFVLAYLFLPTVDRFEYLFRKRLAAVIFLYSIFGLAIGAVLLLLPGISNELYILYQKFPQYLDRGHQLFGEFRFSIESQFHIVKQFGLFDMALHYLNKITNSLIKDAPQIAWSVLSFITYLALVPFILFFFLYEGPGIKRVALQLVPNRYFETVITLMFNINQKLGGYLRGMLFEALCVSLLSMAVLGVLRVEYALIIGATAGLFNMIPYMGPVSGAIPAILIQFMNTHSIQNCVYVAIAFAAIQVIDNMLLQPLIYSQSSDVHPLLILFAAMVGGSFGGLWGMIVSVPLAGIIKVLVEQIYKEFMYRRGQGIDLGKREAT